MKQLANRIIRSLVFQRTARGLTQQQIAAAMHRSQSAVSKLENSRDDDARLSDIAAYARALGLHLTVRLESVIRPTRVKPGG